MFQALTSFQRSCPPRRRLALQPAARVQLLRGAWGLFTVLLCHERRLNGSLGKSGLDSVRSASPGDPTKKVPGHPERLGGNCCLLAPYSGQNSSLVLVEMPPNNNRDGSAPQGRLWPGGERPPHGTTQDHPLVQTARSPGDARRPRNEMTLRKQLGNV